MKSAVPHKPFYYIRHGESEWNVLNKFAGGQMDTPLTGKGRHQAEKARELFENLNPAPTHIIHSTLSRAVDTAKILNQFTNLPMITEYNLREIDAGDWQGKPNSEARAKWAEGLSPPNGESLDMLAKRVGKIFTKILSNDDYEVPFIAAHGRILNGLDQFYGISPRSLQTNNCQAMRFEPTDDGKYPWNVYILGIKNGQITSELADWSQI